jgi:DNA-directed RNA polymerase subunit alpha
MEITVERGMGYSPVETRKAEKLTVGLIGVDALFSPVTRVNYTVENMRVGDRTDYNRLCLEIETDGTISPSSALHKTASALKDHFEKVYAMEVKEFEVPSAKAEEKPKKKAAKKSK